MSDDPPASLVDSTALQFIVNNGEIAPVLRHIFTSQEFLAAAGQKLRRPYEFFIGALRATDTQMPFWRMIELLQDLAQLPYGWHPPDGYPDVAGAWMNSNGGARLEYRHDANNCSVRVAYNDRALVGAMTPNHADQNWSTRRPGRCSARAFPPA
ncbi:MAG: DUF1800 family protein [Chloroflexi bacterium]|uniref:DUF1800 family protein n=1 Tax=Candidatus Flexifilum breve TaxID=3140694 RepID=UPI003136404C|nr:DUF1800 family protein [Chloroflexota bacterium]